jgi:predicted alpha/beta hydrolase family esterase
LIILIGHSMGGFCVLKFSEILQGENIPVSRAVTIDPPQVSPRVPPNIERYLNIFLSKSQTNSNTSHQIPVRVIGADKVNVHPVCDVLSLARQSHSLRGKPSE